ncbi:MAG: hypothetical protein WCP97_02135 [bacterium]
MKSIKKTILAASTTLLVLSNLAGSAVSASSPPLVSCSFLKYSINDTDTNKYTITVRKEFSNAYYNYSYSYDELPVESYIYLEAEPRDLNKIIIKTNNSSMESEDYVISSNEWNTAIGFANIKMQTINIIKALLNIFGINLPPTEDCYAKSHTFSLTRSHQPPSTPTKKTYK